MLPAKWMMLKAVYSHIKTNTNNKAQHNTILNQKLLIKKANHVSKKFSRKKPSPATISLQKYFLEKP